MSFPSTTIIELKESNAIWHGQINENGGVKKVQNGNYDVLLDKPIPLNDGDEISIKSLYIDSIAVSSNKIVVEKDLPLTFGCVNYIQNNDTNNRSYNDSVFPNIPNNQPDCKAYFACNKTEILDVNTAMMVGQMNIYQQTPNKPWGRKGLFLKVIYTDLTGQTVFMNLPIPLNDGKLTKYEYNNTTP